MEAFVTLKKRPKFPLYRTFLKFCTKHLNYANVKKASLNKNREKERMKLSLFKFVDIFRVTFYSSKLFQDFCLRMTTKKKITPNLLRMQTVRTIICQL